MTRLVHASRPASNFGTDVRVGNSSELGGVFDALRKKVRSLWKIKTAPQVATRAHISVRSAERFLAQENELSTAAIIHLLRSDQGLHFLLILMGRSRPAWWSNLLRLGILGGIERRREADLRLLRQIAGPDADTPPAAAISSADMLQDADFYGPFLEAMRSMAAPVGAPDSAVERRRKD